MSYALAALFDLCAYGAASILLSLGAIALFKVGRNIWRLL